MNDEWYKILGNSTIKELMAMRLTSQEWRDLIDTSFIWCDRLKKEFNINTTSYKDCFEMYRDFYKKRKLTAARQLAQNMGIYTPLTGGNRIFQMEDEISFLDIKGMSSGGGYTLDDFDIIKPITKGAWSLLHPVKQIMADYNENLKNYMNFFTIDQLRIIVASLVKGDPPLKLGQTQIFLIFQKYIDSYSHMGDIYRRIPNKAWALFNGIVMSNTLDIITDETLNKFTLAWDGDIEDSKEDKLNFVVGKQNIYLDELFYATNRDVIKDILDEIMVPQ